MSKDGPIADYELVSSFELERTKLLGPDFADCLDKPLAFWAMPTDRRLPLALMAKPLRELLATPFPTLFATPGIGRKKIRTMIELLSRVSHTAPGELLNTHMVITGNGQSLENHRPGDSSQAADVAQVSELMWSMWRDNVRQFRLGDEPLGRFAPALRNLPRVIWTTPLSAYLDLSLADMRALKTYGEKRVTAVLEIFAAVHAILVSVACHSHLAVRIAPRFSWEIENWVNDQLATGRLPDLESIRHQFVEPLLVQVQIDGGDPLRRLLEQRLGWSGKETSIRSLAHNMDLTRARVYQLLEEIHTMLQVRWSAGRQICLRLERRLNRQHDGSAELNYFRRAAELFFPDKQDSGLPNSARDPSAMS